MRLPVGYDNFKKIIDRRLDFVDKSLFIKEILDDTAEVVVITRPRRFGKTLNLSMLHHFLAAEVNGQSTVGLFDGLKIATLSEECKRHQGQYPVIFMTFKDVKDHGFEHALQKMMMLMAEVYKEHRYLLSSPRLSEEDKIFYKAILNAKVDQSMLEGSIKKLTACLYQHHGVKPWLLIDEYDTPIQSGYLGGYYQPMISCMRNLFGSALKTNPYLERAVITGVLRVAKESLFSGLNNLRVYSVLQSHYGQYFGFTEDEVLSLLRQSGLTQQTEAIRDWYNGYQVGQWTVYNPWSIVNCIREQGELAPYWINTSDNQLIKDMLIESSEGFRTQFEDLLRGESLEKMIDENVVFGDLKNNEAASWSLLLMAGYLKVLSKRQTEMGAYCTLSIPNREVRGLYRRIIQQWLSNGQGIEWFEKFLNHLLTGDIIAFEADLRHLIEETFSVHDTSKDPEVFYHGFMVGATASLYHHKNYEIKSNRESGYGRYDYMIFSHDLSKPTILMEIKRVKSTGKTHTELERILSETAQQALTQIQQQNYLAEAKQRGRTYVLKIGLAFCGKQFKIQCQQEPI
jgi:Predicted AAA-ATPase/PD-(D/E)XK nuclease superfamily